MNSHILTRLENQDLPLNWVNLDFLPDSKGQKIEIYLTNQQESIPELIMMFYLLFGEVKDNIKIYNSSWWDFCLDTWNHDEDAYDYTLERKSIESKNYLKLLQKSEIEKDYGGTCACNNWDGFLSIILPCILNHQAPFSPIFYDEKNDFIFYFHHTFSIGFYYRYENDIVQNILNLAKEHYDIPG